MNLDAFATLPLIMSQHQSRLLLTAIALLEARNVDMVTSEEWEKLAKAVEAQSGKRVEWRTDDEIVDAERKAG